MPPTKTSKLKRNVNGTYTVKTKDDAKKALLLSNELRKEIEQIEEDQGLLELRQDATALKQAATQFLAAKGIDGLDLGDLYATLRRDAYARRWIATDEDLADAPEGAKSLRTILRKKFKSNPDKFKEIWRRITKPVAVAEEVQWLVDEGIVEEDEIAPAFVEKTKAPFVLINPKAEDEDNG